MAKAYVQRDTAVTGKYYVEMKGGGDTPGGGGISYSTEEQDTGLTWIDGKKIYQLTVDCGAGPINTTKDVPHGIDNIDTIINMYGVGISSSNTGPIPLVMPNGTGQIRLAINANDVKLISNSDTSGVINIYVTMQYTKTE